MFAGKIEEEMIFPFPSPSEDEGEMLRLILENLKKFASDHIDSAQIDSNSEIPEDVMMGLKEMGIFGLQVPESYGGLGLSQYAYGRVFEEVGRIDSSVATTLGAHMSIGMKALLLFGTDAQKEEFLPKLVTGEMLAGFALTEPGSGSDAYSIKTRAEKNSDGSYSLSGNKIWITNGGIADFFTVFAKTETDSKDGKKDQISAFIVTRDMEGFSSGKPEHKMGIRGSNTTELAFNQVRVPAENMLGEKGKGFKIAMEVLNSGRLGLATACVGSSKGVLAQATRQATERKQFGQSISNFGLIQEKLGRMALDTFVTESVAYLTCGLVDAGVPDFSLESAMSKIDGSRSIWSTANHAVQVAGGNGYMQEYPYERWLRDARINLIFEGTNEILTLFIALSGIKGVGERLKIVGKALNDPIKSLGVLYDFFVTQKIQRSLYGDKLNKAHPELKREAGLFEEDVQEFAEVVEKALRKHRKNIMTAQFALGRLTEIALDLYRMVSVISRATNALTEKGPEHSVVELSAARACCEEAHRRIGRNFRLMDRNSDDHLKTLSEKSIEKTDYPGALFL